VKAGDALVSVLVPSRCRVPMLEKSLKSLVDLADGRVGQQIDIIIRYDDDDTGTRDYLDANTDLWTTAIHGPRGNGYADLHLMYNDMCKQAMGRFLFLWNDDAEMLTPGWDREIARHDDGKPCYLTSGLVDGRGRDSFLFPLVHRSWYDTTGHFSMSAHNDTYVYNAFRPYPQLFRPTNISVKHNALDILRGRKDLTSEEAMKWWPTTKATWNSPEVQHALARDIIILGQLVKQPG
jgi:hypothetical protein